MNYQLIAKAKQFAIEAHSSINHRRKYTDEPYHVHLEKVAYLVSLVCEDENAIAAAWLHDVLEDVAPINEQFNSKRIRDEFGEKILKFVEQLTDSTKEEGVNRATRKKIDRARLCLSSHQVKTIKLADIIDNALSIVEHDKHFSVAFMREIEALLPNLKEGNSMLYKIANELVLRFKQS